MRTTHACVWGMCVALEVQREVYSRGCSLYFNLCSPWGSNRRSELQDIAFFIKAPAVLLCKLQVERFQLMMIARAANIDFCLHYRSGVLVKFLWPTMPGRFLRSACILLLLLNCKLPHLIKINDDYVPNDGGLTCSFAGFVSNFPYHAFFNYFLTK